MNKENKCLYCDTKEKPTHFISECCGSGMCEECYNNLIGTDEQIQIDFWDYENNEENILKFKKWDTAAYICFDCFGKAQDEYNKTNLYDLRFIEHLETPEQLYLTKDIEEFLIFHNNPLIGFNENISKFKEIYA